MLFPVRFLPGFVALGLLVGKMYNPDLLASPVSEAVPISWWAAVFWVSAWLAAWMLTPGILGFIGRTGRVFLIPPFMILAILYGLIAIFQFVWNDLTSLDFYLVEAINNVFSRGEP